MLKTRKVRRNIYIVVILIIIALAICQHIFSEQESYGENTYKLVLIEEAIQSRINHGECKIPNLPVDNPEMMKFYKTLEPLNCGNSDDDWVECKETTCRVKNKIIKEKGPITCTYKDLVRKSDYKLKYGKSTHTTKYYTLSDSDFARVFCKAEDGDRWNGIGIGIRNSVNRPFKKSYIPYLNVLMLGFDSLSRNAFIRKMPKTYKFLTEELKGHVLQGYNIIGDGTPQALIPILTGYTELELPETRKRMSGSTYVNKYPMIWKDYENVGYVTAFNEDLPEAGTFTYRLNGFDEQPTDHYMRTYYLEVSSVLSSYPNYCIGHQPAHQVMLNYTKNFMTKYRHRPRFVFSFHGELSHGSINEIQWADEDVMNWLIDLRDSKILNNTILILMSDHGNRYAEVRNTLQGKQEERLPFFSFTFPKFFKEQYLVQYNNFLKNIQSLTTPFDIHATFKDILRIQSLTPLSTDHHKRRALSLFDVIPKNRSCSDAYIEPHWCTCLNWMPLNDTNSDFVTNIAQSVVDSINNFTSIERNRCEILEVKEVNWILKLSPHENLLKFKKNLDHDGFLADLSANTKITTEMYQIKVTVTPGNSIFEASVSHHITKNMFIVNLSDISRINKYGSQANCIYGVNPELRKYCYCKSEN